jgi:MFS family permease
VLRGALGLSFVATASFDFFNLNLPVWFALHFFNSAGWTMVFIISEAWIVALAPPARRGLTAGFYGAAVSVGFTVGPLLAAAFGIGGFLPFAAALLFLGFAMFAGHTAGRAAPPVSAPAGIRPHGLWAVIKSAPLIFFAAFVAGAVEVGIFQLLPVYGRKLGLSAAGAALLLAAAGAGSAALQIPAGLFADRFGGRAALFVAALITLIGAFALPFVARVPLIGFVIVFFWGGAIFAVYTVALSLLGGAFSGEKLISATGGFSFSYGAATLIAAALAGFMMERLFAPHGYVIALALFAAPLVVAAAVKLRGGL